MPISTKKVPTDSPTGKMQSIAGVHANKKQWAGNITPETYRRLSECIRLVAESGYTKQDVLDYLMEKYELSVRSAKTYYSEVMKALRPENMEEYRQTMVAKNFERLEALYRKAVDRGNLSVATEVVKTINQMLGVGGNKLRIGQENADGTQQVLEITFD